MPAAREQGPEEVYFRAAEPVDVVVRNWGVPVLHDCV
jgi:hypothetical protein